MKLEGVRAVVTGASRGIGKALAVELGRSGASGVVLNARSHRGLEETARQVTAGGARAHVVAGDIGEEAICEETARVAGDAFGALDLVVANAGIINTPMPNDEVSRSEWEEVLRVNVLGVARLARSVWPLLGAARRTAALLNLSSTWGRVGAAAFAPYCASKFAIEGLSQSLAAEAPSHLIVCAVNPGVIDTDMLKIAFDGATAGYPSPEDCARGFIALLRRLRPRDSGRPQTVDAA